MTFPKPVAGMVIRYSYLWSREKRVGHEEGSKDRPCAVVLTMTETAGTIRTYVLPITHSPPADPSDAIEIPSAVKNFLGLDDDRSWILLSELNVFRWPGYDLRPIGRTRSVVYGMLPKTFFKHLRERFLLQQNYDVVKRT